MTPRIRSVNLGRAAPVPGLDDLSAIAKSAVATVAVRDPGPRGTGLGSGVAGDDICDRRHHGGERQAVYAVAAEELQWWADTLGRPLAPGTFGENLTTEGLDVDAALVGERWRVGSDVVLEVTGPRIPCATFAAHMGERGWVKRFSARGRTGAYLRVLAPGGISAGDPVRVEDRPDHDIDVPTLFRALMGDVVAARRVLDHEVAGEHDAERLRRLVAR